MGFTTTDYKMRYLIDGDAKDLKGELAGVDRMIAKVGGSASSSFSSIGSAATIAATGVAAIGSAGIAAGAALFNLTRQAADYGSEIFDATQKTGLGAKTMGALKVAADQSGSSLEGVSGAVAKFNVLLGEANQGNEKAQKTLAQYGITAKDTDGALSQAIATIARMTDVDQQAAAAKALFKDRTAEILPVIKSFDGNLPALIDKLDKMGVLLGEDDLKAADEFGDQLDTLTLQLGAAGRAIGTELMKNFTPMARDVSNWLVKNKDEIRTWGQNTSDALRGIASLWRDAADAAGEYFRDAEGRSTYGSMAWASGALSIWEFLKARGAKERQMGDVAVPTSLGEYLKQQEQWSRGAVPTPGRGPKPSPLSSRSSRSSGGRSSDDPAKRAADLAARDAAAAIEIEQRNLKTIEDSMEAAYAAIRKTFEDGLISADTFLSRTNTATESWADNLNRSLSYIEALEDRQIAADATEHERALHQQKQDARRHELKLTQDAEIEKAKKLSYDNEQDRIEHLMQLERERFDKTFEEWQKKEGFYTPPGGENPTTGADLFRSDSKTVEPKQMSELERYGASLGNFSDMATQALTSMNDALGASIASWLVYGDSVAGSMAQATASILANLSQQAVTKALWETAEGIAALARAVFGDPKAGAEAALHFKSAALYGAIGVAAGLGGRAFAGGGKASGGGGRGSSSNQDDLGAIAGGRGGTRNQDQRPYSRYSDDTFTSGWRDPHAAGIAMAIEKLNNKLDSMRPGDVLTTGMRQKPGVVGKQAAADIGRNASIGKRVLRSSGVR